MKAFRKIFLTTVIIVTAYMIGTAGPFWKSKAIKYELEKAFPSPGLLLSRAGSCVEPNETERALVKIAVDILAFPEREAGSLSIGAKRFLAYGIRRGYGRESVAVCDIPEEYERATQIVNNSEHFQKFRMAEYELKLIARLPNPSANIAKAVAKSAFNERVQQSDIFPERDIRPLAFSTLAGLGQHARPYASQAFERISITDSMGTGAAQVAVAGEHPKALQTVEKLMTDELAAIPNYEVVPWRTRNRLYEMAHALAFGGPQAKPHIAPLLDLMGRSVQSWAPPFGMIDHPPRRMCSVLAAITGASVADTEFSYCADDYPTYEQ